MTMRALHTEQASHYEIDEALDRLADLKTEGRAAAEEARGHRLGDWYEVPNTLRAVAHCLDCDRHVVVIGKPRANETNLSGDALALECRTMLKLQQMGRANPWVRCEDFGLKMFGKVLTEERRILVVRYPNHGTVVYRQDPDATTTQPRRGTAFTLLSAVPLVTISH